MAHYYGSMDGNRGMVTRCGTRMSGIRAHLRSWTDGVFVSILYNPETKTDDIYISRTGGSKNESPLWTLSLPQIESLAAMDQQLAAANQQIDQLRAENERLNRMRTHCPDCEEVQRELDQPGERKL